MVQPDRPSRDSPEEGFWYACYTRGRHEKRVEKRLAGSGLRPFLPLVHVRRVWHDRQKLIPWPLFPSYVFAKVRRDRLSEVSATPGVVGVVQFGGVPARIQDEEIMNVRRFARALDECDELPAPEPLVQGQAVRVVSGSFEGVQGVVVENRGRGRVVITVGLKALRAGIRVDVSIRDIEPLDGWENPLLADAVRASRVLRRSNSERAPVDS